MTPSEIRDSLREQVSGLERLGGYNDTAIHILTLSKFVLALADEVVRLEAIVLAKQSEVGGASILAALKEIADANDRNRPRILFETSLPNDEPAE
jgi:hypothetical protein